MVMVSKDTRAQLLANLKFLYGSNVDVITLCVPDGKYQALATSLDPFTAKWTKFLHSELEITTQRSIEALLQLSEVEVDRVFSTSGNTTPFQGAMEQTFTIHRGGQRRDSISAGSMASYPIVTVTPASTLSDTGARMVEVEQALEVPAAGESLKDKAAENLVVPIVETVAVPPEEEPVEDWPNWGFSSKKKKKKKARVEESPFDLDTVKVVPEIEIEDNMGWGDAWTKKNKKKGKNMPIEAIEETPAPDLVVVPPQDDSEVGNTFNKDKAPSSTPTPPTPPIIELVLEPVEDYKPDQLHVASPLHSPLANASESVWHSDSVLSAAAPTKSTANNIQTQLAQTPGAVVFTIELPNEPSSKSLQVMTTIADDTHTAIIDSINSYLDLHNLSKSKQERKVKIKYGIARNGLVDVSTLEETLWPQYLDYFRQYTKIPELTVEIVE